MFAKTVLPWVGASSPAARRQTVCRTAPAIEVVHEPERKTVVWISGLWNKDRFGTDSPQLRDLKPHFPKCRFVTIVTPGHEPDDARPVSLTDWARSIHEQIEPYGPCSVIGHSAGAAALVHCANLYHEQTLFTDVVMLAGSPLKATEIDGIPMQLRFGKLRYLLAMWRETHFRLTAEDERFTRNSNAVNFSYESGLVARQILFRQVKCQTMREKYPSLVIAATRDQFMPTSVQKSIADFHGSAYGEVEGTHMFHCDPQGAADIAAHIREFWAELPHPSAVELSAN